MPKYKYKSKEEQLEKARVAQKRFQKRHKNDREHQENLKKQRKKLNLVISKNPKRRKKRNKLARKSQRKRYNERKTDAKFRDGHIKTSAKWVKNHPYRYLLTSLKSRAKQQGVPFNIDEEYLKSLPLNQCPITKVKMIPPWECKQRFHPHKATIDKVVPKKGYIKGNIAWVSFEGNLLKSNHSIETLEATARFIRKFTSQSDSTAFSATTNLNFTFDTISLSSIPTIGNKLL